MNRCSVSQVNAAKMVRLKYFLLSICVLCTILMEIKSEVTEEQMRKTADLMRLICMKKVKVSKGENSSI